MHLDKDFVYRAFNHLSAAANDVIFYHSSASRENARLYFVDRELSRMLWANVDFLRPIVPCYRVLHTHAQGVDCHRCLDRDNCRLFLGSQSYRPSCMNASSLSNTRGTICKIEGVLPCRSNANRHPHHLFRGLTWARIRKDIYCIQLDTLPFTFSDIATWRYGHSSKYITLNMMLRDNRDNRDNRDSLPETAIVLI